jgi:hypothetical protein
MLPSHRHSLLAVGKIAQACSWAGPNIEVVVRDNSGDPNKREMLRGFEGENRNIIIAEPCDGPTNLLEILRVAKGEFVFFLADDDTAFDQAVAAIPTLVEAIGDNRSIVGITGNYVIEMAKGSAIVSYRDIESDDLLTRVVGFLGNEGPNILPYAPLRRDLVLRVFDFARALPFWFSFHDQVVSLLYLMNGKFVRLPRLLYQYDLGVWENGETAQKRDVDFYREAGLDPAINKLHWFLCGFEGAMLVRNSNMFPDYPLAQRQAVADQWFAVMFNRFKGHPRLTFGSALTAEADKLCAKLQASTGQLTFQLMLAEIAGFIGMSSPALAHKYFEFWEPILNRRKLFAGAEAAAS